MRPFAFAPVLLALSVPAWAGWGTGHPVPAWFASGTGLVFDAGAMFVTDLHVDRCDITWDHYAVDVGVDPVANDTITLPNGPICGIDLDVDGPIVLEGHGTGGGTFVLELDVATVHVEVSPQLTVTNQASAADGVELAAQNWVTASALGLDPNDDLVIASGHGLHDGLAAAVANDSRVLR